MSATTKEQQRCELHKTIWSIADDLHGSVDGWDFKNYILVTPFYRFISENLCAYLAEREGDPGIDYARLPDDQATYRFCLPSEEGPRREIEFQKTLFALQQAERNADEQQ